MKKTERILLALVLILIAALAWYVFGGSLCRRTTPTAAPTMVAASMPMTRVDITFKLVRLNEQRERVYRDLNAANGALDDVRKAYGFSNLEEDSYPDPFTSRLVRLELEKDNCRLEIMELEANVENLKKQQGEDTTNDELKAKLRDSQDKLVGLAGKLQGLEQMWGEAEARKREFDMARILYKQRTPVRDEIAQRLNELKTQIYKFQIMLEEPEYAERRAKEDPTKNHK